MNNMLLSSALSSKAIEETGAARRELLLVNPVDGSDLLFELLSTVTEDPRHGTGVVSILRNVSDLRRASEEIEENYRKLRLAEANARAESDRLNLIIDSVADPIVVTDGGGATSLMNEPAERLFTTPARASSAEQRSVQSNDAHFSSFIAGMLVSPDQRRVGEIALTDPKTGLPMPVEAIAGKILSEHGELTHGGDHSPRSSRGDREGEPVRAAEAGVRRARTQDPGGHRRYRTAERDVAAPGDRSGAGLRVEVAVPEKHVARVPHAAQRDARLHVDAAPGRVGPGRSRR